MAQGFPLPPSLSLSTPRSLESMKDIGAITLATGLRETPEEVQVANLLICLGTDALNVLDGLCLNEDDQKKASVVLDKLEVLYNVMEPRTKLLTDTSVKGV